jgi:hypothetical protein
VVEVADVFRRDAQRDHDLGERVPLLETFEHERRELAAVVRGELVMLIVSGSTHRTSRRLTSEGS